MVIEGCASPSAGSHQVPFQLSSAQAFYPDVIAVEGKQCFSSSREPVRFLGSSGPTRIPPVAPMATYK
jgi:hypothetical protein